MIEVATRLVMQGVRMPPWTFVNLIAYAATRDLPVLRRASYVSMCATWICFESLLLLDPLVAPRLRAKQGLGVVAFYVADVAVHWLPLVVCYVPPRPRAALVANLLGLAGNLARGVVITGGTMDLSDVYVPLDATSWRTLWTLSVVAHMSVGF